MSIKFDSPIKIAFLENPKIFERVSYDGAKDETIYKLNAQKLSKGNCHMFWNFQSHRANLIVATALEHFTFNPLTKLNDKFDIRHVCLEDFELFWCTFPKEYKEICENTAKIFKMRIINSPMTIRGAHKTEKISQALALTLADDYKERRLPRKFREEEVHKPVRKDALAIPVKKHLKRTVIEFPKADHILWVQGSSYFEKIPFNEVAQWQIRIALIGNEIEDLGID